MMKSTLVAASLGLLGVCQAHAQASNFEGFSIGMSLEAEGASANATDGTSGSATTGGIGLQGRYDWALNDKFVLGAGASISAGNRQAGTYMNGNNVYSSNRVSLDLQPGYAISKSLLVYGKVSAISAAVAADDGSGTTTVPGTGYGFGVRNMIDRNGYWEVGFDSYKLNDATFGTGTTASLKGNVLSIGVGYKY